MGITNDAAQAAQWVLGGALVLGTVLGTVGQATRFCVRGGIADWVLARNPGRLLSWLLAVGVGAVGVQLAIAMGAFDATRTLAWNDRFPWASYLVGGTLFGFGMVLGGGCPQRHLVKTGAGDLKALVTLVVTAIAAAMTLRGAFATWRVEGLDGLAFTLPGPQDLGSLLGGGAGLRLALAGALLLAVLALGWRSRRHLTRAHWAGGIVVGLLVPAAYLLTGHAGFIAEHPDTLEPAWVGTQSRRPEGLSFSAPMAHALDLLTLWTDKSMVVTFGVMLSLGVLAGSFASARLRGEWKPQSFTQPRELAWHLLGGVLMGFGGVTALGCSIGNGVTGLAMLSAGAVLAVAGVVAGAVLALRLRLNHEATGARLQPA